MIVTVFHISVKSRPPKGILDMYHFKRTQNHLNIITCLFQVMIIMRTRCTHQPILAYVLLEHMDSTLRSWLSPAALVSEYRVCWGKASLLKYYARSFFWQSGSCLLLWSWLHFFILYICLILFLKKFVWIESLINMFKALWDMCLEYKLEGGRC